MSQAMSQSMSHQFVVVYQAAYARGPVSHIVTAPPGACFLTVKFPSSWNSAKAPGFPAVSDAHMASPLVL